MSGNGDWCGLGQRAVGDGDRDIAAFFPVTATKTGPGIS